MRTETWRARRDGQCEAWCWTHGGKASYRDVIRQCSRLGIYDGVTQRVLCSTHVDRPFLAFSEREARDRRRIATATYKERMVERGWVRVRRNGCREWIPPEVAA